MTVKVGGRERMLTNVLYVAEGSRRQAAVVERLSQTGLTVATAPALPDALQQIESRSFALCLVDLMANGTALAAVRAIKAQQPQLPIAGLFDPANIRMAADAIEAGAVDVLAWPFDEREAAALLANARDRLPVARAGGAGAHGGATLITRSPAMQVVAELIAQASRGRAGVCVSGEPGSGRTLVGQTIHRVGDPEGTRPFVLEDCAGQTPQELERRLFGFPSAAQKGSPAGPDQIGPAGALYLARGGTLLLRNLIDAPARVQGRLARVLRDREAVLHNGRRSLIDLDIQPIATLEAGIEPALEDGRLRPDLFKQLAQVRIDMPALRRRREDIPLLAVQMLRQACVEREAAVKSFSRAALQVIAALPWNGNATELRGLLDTLVSSIPGPVIQLEHVLEHANLAGVADPVELGATLREAKARFERDCISAVLMRHHGRVPEAAKALGIQRTNLYRRIRQLNVARSLLSARR